MLCCDLADIVCSTSCQQYIIDSFIGSRHCANCRFCDDFVDHYVCLPHLCQCYILLVLAANLCSLVADLTQLAGAV